MTAQDFTFSSELSPASALQALEPGSGSAKELPLSRRDILAFENMLREDLASILPFEAHALYFPVENEVKAPEWIAEEGKLLLPLQRGEAQLGVLLLRNPDCDGLEALLPFLPKLLSLCLDKLALYRWGRLDTLTGLSTRQVLLESLAREIRQVRRDFASGPELESGSHQEMERGSYQGSLGIIVLRLARFRNVARGHGHGTSEKLLRALGASLRDLLAGQAQAARTGDEEFAILLPGASPSRLEQLADDCVHKLNKVRLQSRLTGTPVQIESYAGFALFPQDWEAGYEGREARDPSAEAESLFGKARLAAFRALEMGKSGPGVLGFGFILPAGGIVDRVLPLSRVRVNLGRDVGAREGQRFTVWSVDYPVQGTGQDDSTPLEPLYKGEIVLADVREDSAQADILLLGDPTWPIAPGDRLNLVPDDYSAIPAEDHPGRQDPLTGLYRHGDFLARLAMARERHSVFGLALARFEFKEPEDAGDSKGPQDLEHAMAEAAALLRHVLAGRANYRPEAKGEVRPEAEREGKIWPFEEDGSYLLAGRYSLNSILLFHPGLDARQAKEIYEPIATEIGERLGLGVAIGIACLPWLAYRAADAVECCRKALDYAILLPEPHVGVFDSLAINISADKRYGQGDVFGAIEEYRLSLLADESNTLAWNSLGVCLAGVGRHGEARRAFERAVTRDVRDPSVHYNLGTACLNTGDSTEAGRQFRLCLELEPGYSFAEIKLGEIAERDDNLDEARRHYKQAQQSEPGSPVPYRCLARLDIREGQPDKARERLHQALLRDPQDAFSLNMMARLYLDGGEDPELAETLARQSVALRPDRKNAWLELARSLEAQGRHSDAREARVKAGNL